MYGFVAYYLRVVFDVGRRRDGFGERCDEGEAAERFDEVLLVYLVAERERVDGDAALRHGLYDLEGLPVARVVKILRGEHFDRGVERFGIEKAGAEDRPFSLEVEGRYPLHSR